MQRVDVLRRHLGGADAIVGAAVAVGGPAQRSCMAHDEVPMGRTFEYDGRDALIVSGTLRVRVLWHIGC
jgi:hypothetical protein